MTKAHFEGHKLQETALETESGIVRADLRQTHVPE
jgi:hypothetical protein